MALVFTANELITSIRNLGMVPDSGTTGSTDADILRHMNEELTLSIVPTIIATRENYLLVTIRTTLASSTLKYRLPERAIGDALRYVRYVNTSGSRAYNPLEEAPISHLHEYNWSSTSSPEAYYIEGQYLCLVGSSFSGYLEISYHFRPGELVLSSAARQITAVNLTTKTVTLSANVPATWTTANSFDVHSAESGAEIKIWSESATVVSSATITFSNAIDGTTFGTHPVEVGDWVCLEKEAAVPAIPRDCHPLLIRAMGYRMAEAKGDIQAVRVEHDLYREAEAKILGIMKTRGGKTPYLHGTAGILWKQRVS